MATPSPHANRAPELIARDGGTQVHLTLAIADYDHIRDLVHGVVRPDGIALTSLVLEIEEIFHRSIKHLEFDVSEMSFAKYTALTAQGDTSFVGLPVFPSRVFRHSAIYVRADRNIKTAKDLEGKTVGLPEWAQTAGIYARGFLAEGYGVDLTKIKWLQAGVNAAGRADKVKTDLPAGVSYEARPQASLSSMLESGELDAAITARVPDAFAHGKGVVRLYPDYRAEEAKLYKQTGVFPIMHIVVMRRAAFERHPWIAVNLLKAFEAAKARSVERVRDLTASRFPLPWGSTLANEFDEAFGADPFPYGLEANRHTLTAFCRYAHAQGVTARLMTPDELFPAEVRTSVKV
ncbi:MAG: 4,5-dihydroxyphthalate decarboxylase [Xanthobacteraceae bacterium]|nr:4,5-dihydroxyphthalate decarboxylase [Xanthobacteraceae bacterium]